MKATKLIINGEVQNIGCEGGVRLPVSSDYPEAPHDGDMFIFNGPNFAYLKVYFGGDWYTIYTFYDGGLD